VFVIFGLGKNSLGASRMAIPGCRTDPKPNRRRRLDGILQLEHCGSAKSGRHCAAEGRTRAGAFPGAMPVLIGYVGAKGKLDAQAWELYAILFLWQFPQFMAIAWMYRADYARAGYQVLTARSEKAWFMRWQNVLPAFILVPITVAPTVLRRANPVFAAGTFLLSLGFLCFAARLALIRTNQSARHLLDVSVICLPLVFALEALARV